MNYAAGTYDFYDDKGALLAQIYESLDEVPDIVKEASEVTQDNPLNDFALVLVDGEDVLRKFATADPGNAFLSALYFHFTHEDLPPEAQTIAATHIKVACDHFGIQTPESVNELAGKSLATNVVEVTGKRPAEKVAEQEREDVAFAIERADGSTYFPINDLAQVQAANEYFDRHAGQFVPRERREFAVKVAHVSEQLGLKTSEAVAAYSGDRYSPAVDSCIDLRHTYLMDMDAPEDTRTLLSKLASVRDQVKPDEFANYLAAFDKGVGLDELWDTKVPDPWYSTFGMADPFETEKLAKGHVDPPERFQVGEQFVTEEDLTTLANNGMLMLQNHFGERIATAFVKDPVGQFKALPLPHKKLVARLASTWSEDQI